MSHRREAPPDDGQGVPDSRADAIHESPGKQQSESVGGVESGDDVSVIDLSPANRELQILGENAEHLPVDIVHGGREKKESADDPAITANPLRRTSFDGYFGFGCGHSFRRKRQLEVRPLSESAHMCTIRRLLPSRTKKPHSDL